MGSGSLHDMGLSTVSRVRNERIGLPRWAGMGSGSREVAPAAGTTLAQHSRGLPGQARCILQRRRSLCSRGLQLHNISSTCEGKQDIQTG